MGRMGTRNTQDSLTVRQRILDRVDAVENDETWKGELSEHTSSGRRLGRVKREAVIHSALAHEGNRNGLVCLPAAKKGVIGVAMHECVSLRYPVMVRHSGGSQLQAHLPSRPGNFFPRRDIVRDGAKARGVRCSRGW